MRLDLWKFEFGIIGVHLTYLIACRRTKDFNNFDKLVYAAVAGKYRLAKQQFR